MLVCYFSYISPFICFSQLLSTCLCSNPDGSQPPPSSNDHNQPPGSPSFSAEFHPPNLDQVMASTYGNIYSPITNQSTNNSSTLVEGDAKRASSSEQPALVSQAPSKDSPADGAPDASTIPTEATKPPPQPPLPELQAQLALNSSPTSRPPKPSTLLENGTYMYFDARNHPMTLLNQYGLKVPKVVSSNPYSVLEDIIFRRGDLNAVVGTIGCYGEHRNLKIADRGTSDHTRVFRCTGCIKFKLVFVPPGFKNPKSSNKKSDDDNSPVSTAQGTKKKQCDKLETNSMLYTLYLEPTHDNFVPRSKEHAKHPRVVRPHDPYTDPVLMNYQKRQ